MEIDIEALRAAANAAGGDQWTTDAEMCGASGTFEGHHVWRSDGDAVVRCFSNIGHMPDPIDDSDVAEYVAKASPAVILELTTRLYAAVASIANLQLRMRDVMAESAAERKVLHDVAGMLNQENHPNTDILDSINAVLATGRPVMGERPFEGLNTELISSAMKSSIEYVTGGAK